VARCAAAVRRRQAWDGARQALPTGARAIP
jgi:hypothetical protein